MSLLLEALKKAELAKQAAKGEAPAAGVQAEPSSVQPAPVTTREKLPDISQPLEILTEDLPSSSEKRPAAEPPSTLSLEEPEAISPAPEPVLVAAESARAAERAQAQRIFQVKEMDYNPRRPFYLTVGALALVGVGYAGYVWWQLQPRSTLTVSASSATASRAVGTPAVSIPAQTPAPPPPAPPVTGTVPSGPAIAAPISPVRARRTTTATASKGGIAAPAQRPPAPAAAPEAATSRPSELAPIAVNPPTLVVDPLIEQAYQAFERNDLTGARNGYLRVLAREANNRDALLGLAAIDVRNENYDAAEARYLKLLEMNPRDSYAVAGLVALRSQIDPVASESRLKNMLATQPEAAHLHFTLGNQYARQSRWAEAQAAYFKAYSADPENPDYAFNLAVSLDQVHQENLALEYYRRALDLASRQPANFNRGQTQTRIQELLSR
jgi:tetratricopeptide (TPR) repeat protein